jgi:hypothetical protein
MRMKGAVRQYLGRVTILTYGFVLACSYFSQHLSPSTVLGCSKSAWIVYKPEQKRNLLFPPRRRQGYGALKPSVLSFFASKKVSKDAGRMAKLLCNFPKKEENFWCRNSLLFFNSELILNS